MAMIRTITNQNTIKVMMENYQTVYTPEQKIPCPKCKSILIRNRKDTKVIYFRCDNCNGKFKAEYYTRERSPAVKLYTSAQDSGWLDKAFEPVLDCLREQFNKPYDYRDPKTFQYNPFEYYEDVEDDKEFAWELWTEERHDYDYEDKRHKKILAAIDDAIESALDEAAIKRILRYVFYANALKHDRHYSNIVDSSSETYEVISTNIEQTRSKALYRKRKRYQSPKS